MGRVASGGDLGGPGANEYAGVGAGRCRCRRDLVRHPDGGQHVQREGFAGVIVGSLTDHSFTVGTDDFVILAIVESPSPGTDLHLALDQQLSDSQLSALQFVVDGVSYRFFLSTHSVDASDAHVYRWRAFSTFGWTDGQEIAVSITALPIVTIEAVTTHVEHKKIAEFRLTRTGSEDQELAFDLEFGETQETVQAKFKKGKSTLTLYHWTSETDADDNPICTITWLLVPGTSYVVGDPSTAMVDVEGPGTTCT